MIEVLHLTAHLGGGVGKALATLVTESQAMGAPFRHVIACLEAPEKSQFVEPILAQGAEVLLAPSLQTLRERVTRADVLHLDWWNHPVTIKTLCALGPVSIRLLMWVHVSGLHNPQIPRRLLDLAQQVVFTSPCSMQLVEGALKPADIDKYTVISSAGGLEAWPVPARAPKSRASATAVGYVGTLNFAKLHPNYVDFLARVKRPGLVVDLIGDEVGRDTLTAQCLALGRPDLLRFHGYTTDVAQALAKLDVLAYLLNPCHYGTAENALVEAMAMGVVPVVLNNPAEQCIVDHLQTGMVVATPDAFAEALEWLIDHPQERHAMGKRAMQSVRARFASRRMAESFQQCYAQLMMQDKATVVFEEAFGREPAAWFLSCQDASTCFHPDGGVQWPADPMARYGLLEKSKGSVFHFQRTFPDNVQLGGWARQLKVMS